MYFRLMGKLNARRQNLTEQNEKGFTLIELLVVVIIIGILAAIAIPVYLGVQNNAKDSGVQSDITNLKTAAVSIQTNGGSLPSKFAGLDGSAATPTFPTPASPTGSTATTWTDAGATIGASTKSLSYGPTDASKGTFCIIGVSSTGKTFFATDSKGVASSSATAPCTIA